MKVNRSKSERDAYQHLRDVAADEGCSVHVGVKLSDYVDLGEVHPDYRSWATRAHVDLMLLSEPDLQPVFAVEVDGRHHWDDPRQIERDRQKDQALEAAGTPVQRVLTENVGLHSGRERFTTFIAKLWFLSRDFHQAQEDGIVPLDELFSPWFTYYLGPEIDERGRRRYEHFMPASKIRNTWRTHHGATGVPASPSPQTWTISQERPERHTVRSVLPLNDRQFLGSEVTVGRLRIPGLIPWEVAEDLALAELFWHYDRWLQGEPLGRHVRDLDAFLPDRVVPFGSTGEWTAWAFHSFTTRWLASVLPRRRLGEVLPEYP
ncbi:MAG: DUF2726 domain-containing protein [Actinomycetota bacterium]